MDTNGYNMADLGDKLSEWKDGAGDLVDTAKDKMNGMAEDGTIKRLLPTLLAGGGSALAAGMLTKRKRKRNGDNESRADYLTRVLGNSVMAGGLGAAGAEAIRYGAGQFSKETPAELADAVEPIRSPVTAKIVDTGASPIVQGVTGLGAIHFLGRKSLMRDVTEAADDSFARVQAAGDEALSKVTTAAQQNTKALQKLTDAKGALKGSADAADIKKLIDIEEKIIANKSAGKLLATEVSEASALRKSMNSWKGAKGVNTLNRAMRGSNRWGKPSGARASQTSKLNDLVDQALDATGEGRHAAGINRRGAGASRRILQRAGNLFGHTKGQRLGRGLLGAAGTLAPAIISAIVAKLDDQ